MTDPTDAPSPRQAPDGSDTPGAARPDAEPPSAFDLDDAEFAAFQAEVQRILGPDPHEGEPDRPSRKMFWLLPAPTFAEAIALLREVPSGAGEAGLQRLVAERFPALAEQPGADDWADDP